MASTFGFGVASALASPLVTTMGLIVWQDHWKGSAFALNLYKSCLASIAFLVTVLIAAKVGQRSSEVFTTKAVGYLVLSSTLGILIGDLTWLQALQLIGARRVILVDALTPFIAALFGFAFLGERIRPAAFGGIALTVAGVLLVSLESNDDDDDKSSVSLSEPNATTVPENQSDDVEETLSVVDLTTVNDDPASDPTATTSYAPNTLLSPARETILTTDAPTNDATPRLGICSPKNRVLWIGYSMSLLNAVLDTYGSVLTKQYGRGMSVWEISLIRFGFAGSVMLIVSVGMTVKARMCQSSPNQRNAATLTNHAKEASAAGQAPHGEDDGKPTVVADDDLDQPTPESTCPWYSLPMDTMTRWSWLRVSAGVALVTFLGPSLANYALLSIALALTLTLTSVGPLYALPLTYWMSTDQQPTLRALFGASLAVAGIVVLALWGR